MKIIKNIFAGLAPKVIGKKILFLSDDWGGVRLSSAIALFNLKNSNLIERDNRFDKYDALESNADIEGLFNVLLSYSDSQGVNPVFTALCNIANPKFREIEESGYQKYYYEPFTETLERYPNSDKVYQYYIEGVKKKIFVPEFHGREHVQVNWWLKNLQIEGSRASIAFSQEYFFLNKNTTDYPAKFGLDAAFNFWNKSELKDQKEILESGLNLFSNLMGYKATLFTPPSLMLHKSLEPKLKDLGIKYVDKALFEKMPIGKGKFFPKFHYTGQRSISGVRYLVRNAVFEPNMYAHNDGVDTCLAQIEIAFKHKLPAIISNHRAAFVGGIDSANRDKGLKALDSLIKRILKIWPDVEFITVSDLDKLLAKPSN